MWFLPCFFMTLIIYNILVNVCEKLNKINLVYLICIVMSIIFILVPLPELAWGIDRIFKYIGFVALGNILAKKQFNTYLLKMPKSLKLISCFFLMGLNFILVYYLPATKAMWFLNGILGIIGCTILSLTIYQNKILEYLGKISLVVLCIHGPIYRILIKVVAVFLKTNTEVVRSQFILVILVTSITLGISAILYEILNRFLPWMIGKRKVKQNENNFNLEVVY